MVETSVNKYQVIQFIPDSQCRKISHFRQDAMNSRTACELQYLHPSAGPQMTLPAQQLTHTA